MHVGLCRCSGHDSSSLSSYSTSSPSLSCPTPLSVCGHLLSPHLDISHIHRPPSSYAYTGGISRHTHTLHPSLFPHSIIQPSAPQNMQELVICIIHLAPHSIHCAPQTIYVHTQTAGCAIYALHTRVCNLCSLRLCRLCRLLKVEYSVGILFDIFIIQKPFSKSLHIF